MALTAPRLDKGEWRLKWRVETEVESLISGDKRETGHAAAAAEPEAADNGAYVPVFM